MTNLDAANPSGGLRRLPARYAALVMPFLLSILMTCIVSFISTAHAIGFVPGLGQAWLSAWAVSWIIAFPVLLVVLPVVRRLTSLIVRPA